MLIFLICAFSAQGKLVLFLLIRNKHLEKRRYFPHFSSNKSFKGTVVNRTLPSLHGGSLQITFTVPLVQSLQYIPLQSLQYISLQSLQYSPLQSLQYSPFRTVPLVQSLTVPLVQSLYYSPFSRVPLVQSLQYSTFSTVP